MGNIPLYSILFKATTVFVFTSINRYYVLCVNRGYLKNERIEVEQVDLSPSADLEVQLVQLNHCDGVHSNY